MTAATATATANSHTTQTNNYDDTGSFDGNNISQHKLCNGKYMLINPHSYILCIPHVDYNTTKMDVARAVENQILKSGKGKMSEVEDFKYVQNVTFIRAFNQVTFDRLTRPTTAASSGTAQQFYDPWYKLAMVLIDIPPSYDEYYTIGEASFYDGVCRGGIVINSWRDAFFVAHPRTYFQPAQQSPAHTQQSPAHTQQSPAQKPEKKEVCEYQESAFQKWQYELKLRQLERKVKEHEHTIRQYELDTIRNQNTVNEYAESVRFLMRKKLDFPELDGLNCGSNPMTTYISALNNRYARVCVSDTGFLEANRNMKLKQMNGRVITACDECDTCQELIHSIDHARAEDREEVFDNIEQMICRMNKSVQWFEKMHLNAERSLFGLRNRRVFEDFGAYLNTALEIVEEVTSRISTFTQDLEYARCYGQLCNSSRHNDAAIGANYDYAEYADDVYEDGEDENVNTGMMMDTTERMLQYFDQHHQALYEQQQQQQQQQEQFPPLNLNDAGGVYHEEAVIVEDEEDKAECETVAAATTTAKGQETQTQTQTQQKERGRWLSSWF